jgi:hypothetical protein
LDNYSIRDLHKDFQKINKNKVEKKCAQVNLLSKFTCECKIIHGLSSLKYKINPNVSVRPDEKI